MRRIYAFTFVVVLLLSGLIHKVFFEKMEFVQSKVYPDLYLIKNPISNRDYINKIIRKMVLEKLNNGYINKKENVINTEKTIRFYQYTTAWGFNNGTKHFIENKEDPGGFSSEVLNNYQEYQMAYFKLEFCTNDSTSYFGNLSYFKKGVVLKTETIINNCNAIFNKIIDKID